MLPPILTIAILPYAYLVALYATYENVFNRLNSFTVDTAVRRFAKREIFRTFHLKLWKLSSWSKRIMRFESRDKVRAALSNVNIQPD
jgi:hypothetical protein